MKQPFPFHANKEIHMFPCDDRYHPISKWQVKYVNNLKAT